MRLITVFLSSLFHQPSILLQVHNNGIRTFCTKHELISSIQMLISLCLNGWVSNGYELSESACEESLKTLKTVDKCPSNKTQYEAAERKKNCSRYNHTTCKSFQYHCAFNENMTGLVEVCTTSRYILCKFLLYCCFTHYIKFPGHEVAKWSGWSFLDWEVWDRSWHHVNPPTFNIGSNCTFTKTSIKSKNQKRGSRATVGMIKNQHCYDQSKFMLHHCYDQSKFMLLHCYNQSKFMLLHQMLVTLQH